MLKNLSLILPLLLASCSPAQQQFACNADKLAPALIQSGAAVAVDVAPAAPEVAGGAALVMVIDPIVHAQAQAICNQVLASQAVSTAPVAAPAK